MLKSTSVDFTSEGDLNIILQIKTIFRDSRITKLLKVFLLFVFLSEVIVKSIVKQLNKVK